MVIPRDGNLHFKVVILGNMFEKLLYFLLVLFRKVWYYYRPQRSCGQGNVFTGVCLSTGGRVSASVHAGMPDPPPRTRQTPPRDQADNPPSREADSSIRSTSGRYASHWNAFLFQKPVMETRDLIWRSVVFYINNLLVFPSATTVTEDPE